MTTHFNPDRLEALRRAHRLTKSEFARRIGATRQSVDGWMRGQLPSVASIEKAARAFDLDSSYFFEDSVNQISGHCSAK